MIIDYIKWELTGLVELVAIRLRSVILRHTPPPPFTQGEKQKPPHSTNNSGAKLRKNEMLK